MPKRSKEEEKEVTESDSTSDDSDGDDRSKFESAIDPSFQGAIGSTSKSKNNQSAKSRGTFAEEDGDHRQNNDKYADQRKHLSKKLSKYLDSVIEYADPPSDESNEKSGRSKNGNGITPLKLPSEVRLFATSTSSLPSSEAEFAKCRQDKVLETEAHNKRAKELLKQKQQSKMPVISNCDDSDSSSSSSSEDDSKSPSKKTKKMKKKSTLSQDILACVVTVDPFQKS